MFRIKFFCVCIITFLAGLFQPGGEVYAQCSITNLDPTYCSNEAPVALAGSPGGLTFYRAGVSTPIVNYDPSLVIGADTVVATSGSATSYTISTAGTFAPLVPSPGTDALLGDNAQQGPVPIGFTFNFFGTDYTNVFIGSNALIGFTTGVTSPVNQTLPDGADPDNIIALAWDEMTVSAGSIKYFISGRSPFRKFVVTYDIYRDSNPAFVVETQVQLRETTNVIEIHSTNINIPVNFSTMGIENADGSVGNAVPGRNNQSFTAVNDYVGFIPDCVDIRYVTVSEAPTTADAGVAIIEQCDNNIFTMAANTAAVGTGAWSQIGGPAVTITNPALATTTITGVTAGTSVTLRWTISNGVCAPGTDDIILTNYEAPSAADAGPAQEKCNDGNFTMAAVTPAVGSGTWSQVSGPVVTITDPALAITTVTGLTAGNSVSLRWTVDNGTCAVTTDDVVLTNLATPTLADAGDPSIEQCNSSTFAMAANTPAVGTGAWSQIGGPAVTITNPALATTTITGVTAGTSVTLRWTISNGVCAPGTDDIILTNYEAPSAADAGPPQEKCNDGNFTMAAVAPAVGSGTWSQIGGPVVTITDPALAITTVTGLTAGNSVTLRWTVDNGTCTVTTDDVVLTNLATPTPADAGDPSIQQCNSSTFTMAANTAAVGTGAWSQIGGPAVTITNPALATTTITGVTAGTSVTLRWTISNGVCAPSSDDIILTNYEAPSAADAGPAQEKCNDGNFTMAAVAPAIGSGTWSQIGGPVVTITDPALATTTVTGVPAGSSVTLQWTVDNGTCAVTTDDVALTNLATPTLADAGDPSIEQCNTSTFAMSANVAAVGTGAWSQIGGPAVTITNPALATTTITGVTAGTSVTLRWTISNGVCAPSSDDIILTNYEAPSAADAGPPQEKCNDGNFTMAAVAPAIGSGTWSQIGGPVVTITDPASEITTVTGVPAGSSVTFQWTIDNGTCAVTTDDVVLTNLATPTPADAGAPSIQQCNSSTFTMAANVAAVGTGAWSQIGGPAVTITNPALATTTITGVTAGTSVTLRWTITHGVCAPSSDDIILTNYEAPSAADAGPPQEKCNDGNFTMAAVAPAVGSGTWSQVSGPVVTITDPASEITTVTGLTAGNSVTLRWTVDNGTCTVTTDDVVLTNLATPTLADAGAPSIQQCNSSTFAMAANVAAVGTGAWSQIGGPAVTITNPALATTTITGVTAGTSVTLRWTITHGVCAPSSDDIILTNYEAPSAADAGPPQEKCNDGNFTMAAVAPAVGSGTWSQIGGPVVTITDPALATTTVTGVPAGSSVTLQWTVDNGTCAVTTDDVALTNLATPTLADAGDPSIEQCNTSTFAMSANVAAVGTGAWSQIGGPAVTITNPALATTTITGVTAGTSVTLRWTITHGVCAPSSDDIILTNYEAPSAADAGPAQEKCNDGNFTMAAVAPAVGSGTWNQLGGPVVTITDPASEITTVTGVPAGSSVTLRWTVDNGTCAVTTDDVVLTNLATPTLADAGDPSIEQCNSSTFAMSANVAAVGTGAWSQIGGPAATITNPALATTTITGVTAGTSVTLRWTISNGVCAPSSDDIILTNYQAPSAADAGPPQEKCNDGNFTMAAVAPAIGSGTWSQIGGPAVTITDPASEITTVTGVPAGSSVTLQWTVDNGTCAVTTDDVVLTNLATPTPADAGAPSIEQCNSSTFAMAANTAAVGTGAWSQVGGPAVTITNPALATTTITGVTAGTSVTLRWTISNGVCAPSSDDIILTNYEAPSAADAGPPQEKCNDGNFTMAAVAPAVGSGTWSQVGGPVVTITDPALEITTVTGVPAGSSVTLRWTVDNGTCAVTTDDVVLTNLATPTLADAGDPSIEQCNSSTFAMAANTAAVGTGAWSQIGGPAVTITNPALATTTITGVTAGTSVTLRWTITHGVCTPSSDDIILTNYEAPSAADAGPPQEKCNDGNFTMAAVPPAVGSGTWSQVSGPVVTITDPALEITTVTGVPAGSSVTLRWTVDNGTCAVTTDDVVLTNLATPTLADAGDPSIEQCNSSTFAMAANTAAVGTGAWSQIGGPAVTITNPALATTTITGVTAGTSVTLRWTISNGVCAPGTDDIILTNYEAPSAADAGPPQEKCNDGNFTMAAVPPAVGSGTWSQVSGPVVTITDPASEITTVTGLTAGNSVTLRWTVDNGTCAVTTDDVALTNLATPTPADAGVPSIEQCNSSTFAMAANTPAVGTGAWSQIGGPAVTITNPALATTTITGVTAGTSVTLRWTITHGVCAPSSDDIILTNYQAPSAADAGPAQEKCNDGNFTMAAVAPATGSGTWSQVGGPVVTITDPASEITTVTGLTAGNSVTLRWTVDNGTCAVTTDDVALTNLATPTPADAGVPSIEQCNSSTFAMAANTPAVGTGAWSQIGGPAVTITNPALATTTITGVTAGTSVTLRWTITHGVCAPSSDDIILTNHETPSAADAGPAQEKCNDGNFTMAAVAPAVGSGTWSQVGGPVVTITDPASEITTVTGVPVGASVTLQWTVTNGVCAGSVDDVVLSNSDLPDLADAGPPDIEQCNISTFFMSANVPLVGTGTWSQVAGPAATITNPASPSTTITNVAPGTTVTLRWTISNLSCGSTTDDIVLINYSLPTVSAAGIDQEQCDNGDFAMAANNPAVGTGTWILINGSAGITIPGDPLTTITGVPAGTSATLRWEIANGTCTTSADDVVLTNSATPPVADAGPAQIEQCNNSTFAMNANSPGVGSGLWTLVTPGGAVITNNTSPSTTITNIAPGTSATLRWTIGNGVCGSTSDDIVLTNYELPTAAAAGSDQELCGAATVLAANTPAIGTGAWSTISGANGVITDPGDPASDFNGEAPETYVLRWTITNGVCTTSDDVTIVFKPIPDIDASDKGICSGENTAIPIVNPNGVAGTQFNWIVQSSSNVTGAAGGTGNLINQALTATDGVSNGTVVYRITPTADGCSGNFIDVTVTVSPKPVITTPPASFIQSICSGDALNLLPVSTVPSTDFNWTSSVIGTLSGVSPSGNGAITDTPVNNTSAPGVIIYTVVPSNGSCLGAEVNYVVTVNPLPDVAASAETICSGESTNVAISNPNGVAGTSFSWVVQGVTNVSGAAPGSGNVISQVLTSTDGTSNGTVVYRVTPSANVCAGSFIDVTVTVKPVPVFTNPATDFALQLCSGEPMNFLPSTTIGGATVSWTSSMTGPIDPSSISVSGTGAITDTPVNNGNVSGTVTYHLTPGFNGCDGPGADLVVLVRPLPTATASDLIICSGQNAVINISPAPRNVAGTTFSWTVTPSANVTGAADGNGSTINQTLSTTDANIGTVIYAIVPSANGCDGVPVNVTVTVNPIAVVSAGADFAVCEPLTIPIAGTLGGSSTSATWSVISGLGTLSPAVVSGSTVSSTYTVDPSEIGSTVVFRITTDDPDGAGPCSLAFDEVAVAINQQALVTAPADYEVCEPGTLVLTGTLGGSATSGSWSVVSGIGTLSISSVTGTDVSATYIIDPSEIGTVVTFRLTTNDPDDVTGPCVAESDDVSVTINESPKVDAGPDAEVCEDQLVLLNGSFFGSTTSATWSGGSGPAQFGDVNDPLTTYTLTPADILAGSITLVLTTNDPDGGGPCTNASDQVVITINLLPAVFLSGLQASYAENEPPVNMEGFPAGGSFTGPGVLAGTDVFDPGTANIGFNTIRYTYTDPNGCTNFTERTVVVNELTTTDFGISNGTTFDFSPTPEICANIGRAYLRGIPDYAAGFTPTFFSSPDVPSRIGLDATGYYLDTDGLISGQYYIQYTYTNEFSATSVLIKRVTVYAAPVAAIDAQNACEEQPVQFTDLSTIPNNTLGGTVTEWLWDFDDQDLLNSTQNPMYIYQDPDVYDVTLTVTTDQGCVNSATQQIIIGPPPVVDFTWSGICSTQGTQFANTSTISGGFSSIESYQWDFGDGDITALDLAGNPIPPGTHGGRTAGTYSDPNHLFATFSEYNVTLTAVTDVGCVQDTVKRVYILDYPAATPTSGYFEDFETGNGTWFKTSLTGTSWVLGTPSGETIDAAASGSQSWWTGLNPDATTDNSTYYNNEQSEVIGPCLDLSGLERPMVSLSYWTDTQDGFDGTVLQYSVNGGATWETIGDADGGGIEWYNRTNLNGNPGGQDNFAWSASSLTWKNARYNLDDIPPASRQQVIFRIAFGANDDNLQGSVLNGFAFDDIYIGEKKRNVLVEHFTNTGGAVPGTTDAEAYFNTLFEQRPLSESDFFKLEYHVSNPGVDSINLRNPAAPQARSLFYGVSQPPATVMDGILGDYYGTVFNGNPFTISSVHLDRRSLEDPLFNIELDTLTTSGDKIRGQIRIEYADTTQVQTEPVIVQVALVDSVVDIFNARQFKYVVRKLLLNNEGLLVNQQWQPGVAFVHDFEQNIDVPINENTAHYLVAFVQDKTTRRIHQSIVKPVLNKQGVRPVGLPDDPVMAEIRDIAIYPNPASNVLYFSLPDRLTRDFTWSLVDQRGVTVLDGNVNRSFDQPQAIDISQVANGIYFMRINSANRTLIYRKIAVMNRN